MRKRIVAGNWKMNNTLNESSLLINELLTKELANDTLVIVSPPFTNLFSVAELCKKSNIHVSAQNCASELSGAYTGEVSVDMIKSTGAKYVIIGHSERRSYYKEGYETLKKKTDLALEANLTPIFCCGEVLSEREQNNHFKIVEEQLSASLFHLSKDDFSSVIIAYEPVWAIGTGVTASPEQAQEMHAFIRSIIQNKYGEEIAQNTSILYGGSCKPSNAKELFSKNDVDGGLIGGASLKADDFAAIINSF